MFKRRDVLKYALLNLGAGTLALSGPNLEGASPAQAGFSEARPFDPASVFEMARTLAKTPYKAIASDPPDPFRNLTYEQYVSIKAKPENAIWASEGLGFVLEPLHRGFIFSAPVAISLVENGLEKRLTYDPGAFDFGALNLPAQLPDIGFSGFRILLPRPDGRSSDFAIFQGASFFRALAPGQNFGIMARGLSVRTADPRGEEFPLFRSMWIERPSPANNMMVIHAVLDSESVTGAYRFTLRPGDATIIDTECTLYPRVAIDHIGLGAMSSTALYGPLDRRKFDDVRPAVHEVGGLQIFNGKGEWLWRPVTNRETLQISGFLDNNPHGFGFMQRDRDFTHYQDDNQHWELRPSLWIEPIGEWGEGMVQLVEIPSESEVNDNIIAYWRPAKELAAGSETSFAYRQFWCWSPPERPPLAIALGERGGRAPNGPNGVRRRRFIVTFGGEIFSDAQRSADIKPMLMSNPGGGTIIGAIMSRAAQTFRVIFDIDIGNDPYCEIRLVLEAAGKPVSETWLYRWTA